MMSVNRYLWLLLMLVIVLPSCRKNEETKYIPVNGKEIKIGVLLSLTGTGYSSGEASEASLNLAREDIQSFFTMAGINKTLLLDIVDTKTDTAEALNQLRGFYNKGIRLVIGPYSSAELAHIRTFANNHNMLLVSPSSVAVSLAIPDDNIFRFVTSDIIQGKAMSKMLVDDKVKIIVPIIRNDIWGNDLLAATHADFTKNDGIVGTVVKYDPGTTNFSDALSQLDQTVGSLIQNHNPNEIAVYLLGFAECAHILAKASQYSSLNMVYWYGSSAFAGNSAVLTDTNATLFAYTHGLPCPVYGLEETAMAKWLPLKERIQAQINRVPDSYAFTAYDALWVLVNTQLAIESQADIENIKSAFVTEAGNYFGVTGNTQLDINGDRAFGNYDFWAVKQDSAGYCWKLTAKYNSASDVLTRIKP